MSNLVSRVYSEAFFDLSKGKNNLEKSKEDLIYIDNILRENKKFNTILLAPNIEKNEKKEMISRVFQGVEKDTLNLLKILVDKSRFLILKDLTKEFIKKYNDEFNIAEGIVFSVNKLEESEMKDLQKVLGKKFDKEVILKNEIDESLIGGISILLDGKRIDNSIKFRLENLKDHLRKEGE